ncbi:heavy metal translocating P-type ATPase [Paracoccus sp. Z330]|uniref:P-type Zn(2+) transporter n=1 Tax=Paracoccus onchidii TaxID=3017813 RepID=A0ABT4ZGT0_9RHOB|nr:heavy metal translocating P-type ATPase [Paracoccus onchidii]MDB6178307.1 heavy metal translocating P-type ATPase [Paracoccus onchidii]
MTNVSDPQHQFLFKVQGMDCGGCAATIRTALEGMQGIREIDISVPRQEMRLELSPSATTPADVQRIMKRLGYVAERVTETQPAPGPAPWRSQKAAHLALAVLSVAGAYALAAVRPEFGAWAFSIAALLTLAPIARRAVAAARMGAVFTIQMLMTIAALGAVIIGEQTEAIFVILLFILGEMLEGLAARKAQSGIRALAALLPDHALVEDRDGQLRPVATRDLAIGDQIVIRAGDRIAADGIITSGASAVDESTLTGESIPVAKTPGDRVSAGSINHEATLRVAVDRDSSDNTISRIITLVEDAQGAKAPTERFIDRFSLAYMPIVIAIATLVAIVPPVLLGQDWQDWIYRGLALLLIGCPCALVISVPAAIASSLAALARDGVLIKGGAVLETLAHGQRVVLDKTGTLTAGRPHVTDFIDLAQGRHDTLGLAVALERESAHPLASALISYGETASTRRYQPRDIRVLPGIGMEGTIDGAKVYVGKTSAAPEHLREDLRISAQISAMEAQGKTVSTICLGQELIGLVALRDEPRPESATAMQEIRRLGLGALMLTGDNSGTATAIATKLGIDFKANMLPEEKAETVAALAGAGTVIMVGDGVNDAPALAAAQVGVAIGSGTDVAMEAADAVLMSDRISDVPRMITKARRTMDVIRQNVAMALGLKLVFLVTTIAGLTGLWPAILADTGATVLVTLNSMRLLANRRTGIGQAPASQTREVRHP